MPLIPNNNNNKRINPTFSLPDIKNLNVNLGNTGLDAFVTNQDLANNIINNQEDVDAINAERQESIAKWGKGISNVITGGAIEIAKAPGYLYGLGDWASSGFKSAEIDRAFSNTYLKDLEQLEEFTKGEVYVPKDVKEGNMFEKLWSSGFWGSTVADGAKFMVGMMGVSAATRSLGLGAKIASGIQGLSEAESITANGVKAGIQLNKLSRRIDTGLNVSINTHIEAAQEAKGVYDAIIKQGGSKELAGREAANNYLTNAVILFGPNILFENQFFKNKFKGDEASTRMALDAFETGAAKVGAKKIAANWTKNILLGIGSEAFWEEGMQLASEKYFTNRGVDATKGKLVDENEFSPWGIVKQYWDNVGTDEFIDSVLTGAILGTSGAVVSSVKDTKRANRALNGYTTKYGYKMPGLKDLGATLLKGGYDNLDGIYESSVDDKGVKTYKLKSDGSRVVNKDKFDEWVKANDALQLTAILAQKADSELGEAGVAIKNLFRDKGLMSKFQSYFDMDGGVDLLKKIIDTKIQEEVFDSISQVLDLKQSNAELKKDLLQKVDDMKELYDYNKSSFSKRFKLNPTTKKGSIEEQSLNATKSDNYFTRFDHYTTQYSLNNRIKELEDKKNKLTFFGINTVVNQKERVAAIDAEIKSLTELVNNSILETNKLDSLEEQKKTYEDKLKEFKEKAEKTEAVEEQKPQEVKNAEAMAEATAKANADYLKQQEEERLAAEEKANNVGEDGLPPRDTTDDDPNLSEEDDLAAKLAAKNNVTNGNIMQYLLNKNGMQPDLAAKVENYLSLLDLEHPLVDAARLLTDKKTSKDTLLNLKKQGPEMFSDPSDALSLKAFNKIIDDRIKVLDKEEAERLEREKPISVASVFNNADVLSKIIRTNGFYRDDVFDALLRDLPYEEFVKDLTFTYSKNTNESKVQPINTRVSVITPTHQFNLFYKDKQIGFVPGVNKYLFDGKLITNENIDSLVGPLNFHSYFSKEEKYDVFKEMLNKQSVLNNNLKTLLGNNQFIRLNLEEFSQYADINLSAGELDIREKGQDVTVADLESDTFNYFEGNFVVVQNNIEVKPGESPFRILDPVPVVFKKDSEAKRIRTSEIQDEVTEALNKLQNRDNLGRYLLVVKLGNGAIKFIHLKGSELDSVRQAALIDSLNVRLNETITENTSEINDGKTLKTVTKSNTFNELFNKELNESFMIALPQGFDMKIQVSPSGKITFITSYKAQKHVAGQKGSLGQSLDKNSVYQILGKPIVDMEDLLKHVKYAFKKAITDHNELLSDEATTSAINFTDTITSKNFRTGIPKELNAKVIRTLLTSVNKSVTKRATINIIGKADVSAKPNVAEEEVLAALNNVTVSTEELTATNPVLKDITEGLNLGELIKLRNKLRVKRNKTQEDTNELARVSKIVSDLEANFKADEEVESVVTDLTDVENSDIEADKKWLQSILPDFISVQELDAIYNRFVQDKTISLGKFQDSVIYLGKNRKSTTKQHEAFHAVFRMLLSDGQINSLINAAKQEKQFTKEEIANFRFNRPKYKYLDDRRLSYIMYEEYLAEGFEKWTKDREFRTGNLIKAFYRRLSDFVKNLLGKQSEIEATYKKISSGKFKSNGQVVNRFTSDLSTVSVDAVVRKTPLISEDSAPISRTFTSNESNMIVSMVYHQYSILKNDIQNTEIPKKELLDIALDTLKNRYSDNTVYYDTTNFTEEDYEKLDNMHFAFNNKTNRESIVKTITKRDKIIDAKFTEYEDEVDEHDLDKADLMDKSANHDFKWENFGGIGSLSKRAKAYMNTVYYYIPDPLDKTKQIPVSVNGDKVYSGLVKALANSSDFNEMLAKMTSYNDGETQASKFISAFFEDCGIVYDKETNTYKHTKDSHLFYSVLKTFNRYNVLYNKWQVDADSKESRMFHINNTDGHKYQLNIWQRAFDEKYWSLLEDKSITSEKIKNIKQGMQGVLRDFMNAINEPELSTKDIYDEVEKIHKDLKDKLGMELSKNTIKFAILANKENLDDETLLEFKANFADRVPIDAEDLSAIASDIGRGNNPFIKDTESVDEEEDGKVTKIEGGGSTTRLNHLAFADAEFNENVFPTSFRNAENKTVYGYQLPTFHLLRISDLAKQTFRNAFKSSTETNRNLLLQEGTEEYLSRLKVERLAGLNSVTYKEGSKIIDKTRTDERNKSFDKYTPKELASQLLDMWGSQKYESFYVGGKAVKKNMALHYIRVLEASSTADLVRLPVIEDLINNDGTLSDKAVNLLYDIFLTEADNIYNAQLEINQIKGYLNNDGTPNISQEEWEEKGLPIPILNYHYSIIDGKINYQEVRGLKFFENKFLDIVPNSLKNAKEVKTENFTKKFETDIKVAIKAEYEKKAQNYIDSLVKLKVINENKGIYTNNSLFNNFYNKIVEDRSTIEIDTNKIKDFYLNDFLNTYSINNLLFENEAKVFKDSIMQVKRARGSNAGGPSSETQEKTNVNLVILNDVDRNIKINNDNIGTVTTTDGQGIIFDYALKDLLKGLSKLDAKQEAFIDKIINGELTEADIFGSEGSISRKGQLISLKLVYNDGKNYYKLSVAIVTKDLLYYKGKPRAERMDLVRAYEKGKESKADMILFASTSKNTTGFISNDKHYFNNKSEAKFWRLQQENPSNKNNTSSPSQTENLIDSEQDLSLPVYGYGDKYKTIGDVVSSYQRNLALLKRRLTGNNINTLYDKTNILKDITPENYLDKLKELKTSIDNGTSDINLNDFVAQALSSLEGTGGNEQLLEFFSLDNNDEAKFNLNIASTYDKYVQLLIAHFNNSGFKLKIPGHTGTLMSGYGMNVIEHNGKIIDSDTYNENPSAYSGAKFRRLKHNVEVKDVNGNVVTRYSECLFPAHFAQLFGLKIGDNQVDSRLLEFFGVRIPTQDKHSMVNLRVVGFLPAQMGSTIVVPDEIILLSGADFDIDKLYMQRYDFYVNENNEPIVYGTAVSDEDKFEEYKKWMLSNNKTVKNKFKNLLKNNNDYIQLKQIKKDLLSIIETNKQLTKEEIGYIKEYIQYTEELDASLSKESDEDFMKTLKITKQKLNATLDNLKNLKFEKRVFTNEGEYGYENLVGIIRITHLDFEKIYQVNLPESLLDKINSFKDVLKTIDEIYEATELEAIKETGLPFNLELFNELSKQGEQNPGVLHNNILEAKQILLSNDGIQKNKSANGGLAIGSTPASLDILKKKLLNDPMYKGVWNIITGSLSANSPDGKIRAFSNLMEGAAGIGPIVNFEMIYTVLQKAGIKYDFSPITINGVTYNDYGNLYTDSNSLNPTKYPGIRKFDIISTLVSAMTDNAKEELAAIFRISQDMLPILAHMLILGVNISDALLIINNPIIATYQERLKETKGHLRTKSEKKDLKAFTLIEDMIAELESNKSDETENKDENNLESQEKTPILAKDFELTSKALLEDANGTTNNVKLQKALLLMLKDFKKDTALLNNIIQFTNKNKGLASDMEQFDKFEAAIKELGLELSDEAFKKAKIPFDLRNTITKDMPVLAFYYKQITRLRKKIMPYFLLSASSHFSSIYNSLYENLDNRNKHFKLKKEVTNAIKKDILSYISMLSYKKYLKDNGLTEKFEGLDNYSLVHKKEGEDSIVDIYKKAKALDPTNPFINYVIPNPSHIPNKNRELVPNPNNWKKINLLSPSSKIERDSDYQTAVMDGFKTLYLNPQTKQAAIAIFNYLIVKDGLQYKNESIVNNIANFIFTDLSRSLDITLSKFKNSNLSDTEFKEVFGKTKNQMIKEFVDLYTINGHNSYQLQAVVGDTQKIYTALRENVRGARRITEEESVDDKGKVVIDLRHSIKKVETTDKEGNKITKIKSEKLPFEEYKTVREEISELFGDKFFKEVEEDIQYTDAEDNTVKDSTRILYQFPYRFVIGNRTFRLESYSNSGKKLSVLDNFATGKFTGTRAVYVLDEGYHGNKNVTNLVVTEETQPLYTKDKNYKRDNSSMLTDEDFDEEDNYSEEETDDDFSGEESNSILDVLASRETTTPEISTTETTQPTTSSENKDVIDTAKFQEFMLSNDIYSAIQMLGYKFDKSTSTFIKGQEIIKVEDTEAILKVVKEFSKDNNLKC
jgi:hypothetical protein